MKHQLRTSLISLTSLGLAACASYTPNSNPAEVKTDKQKLELKQDLGRLLYFDTGLSEPIGQACASCHLPGAGFADPDRELPVSRGINPTRFGNRNTPTTAYASYTPEFHFDEEEGLYIGGFFLDGRAPSMKDQAKAPFINPVEMGNPDAASVIEKLRNAHYSSLFDQVYGDGALSDVAQAYDHVADALVAFQQTGFFSPFSSKYDFYLAGKVELTAQEKRGLKLFEDENKGNCAACHPSKPGDDGIPPLFTDYSYDNLGGPRANNNPFYQIDKVFNPQGEQFVDLGLGGVLNEPSQNGKFKVPTLRNVNITPPYMHNGAFNTLEQVVEFYNTRDTAEIRVVPEVAANVNNEELGDLKLSDQEEKDIVAFMKTLTDGYKMP